MAVTFIPTFAFADEEGDVVDDVRAAAQVGVDYIYGDDFLESGYIKIGETVVYSDIPKYIDDCPQGVTYDEDHKLLTVDGYQGEYLEINYMGDLTIDIEGDVFFAGILIMGKDKEEGTVSFIGDGNLMTYNEYYHGIASFNSKLDLSCNKVTIGVEGSKRIKAPLFGIYVDRMNGKDDQTKLDAALNLDFDCSLVVLKYGKGYNFSAVTVRSYYGGDTIINLNGRRSLNYKEKVQVYSYPKYNMQIATIGQPGKFDFKKNIETKASQDLLLVPDLPISLSETSMDVFCYSDSFDLKLINANPYYVDWTTSNKKIAVVDDGQVTPKKAGKCTITADYGGEKFKCTLVVKKPVLSETVMDIELGQEADLAVTGGAGTIKWTTSSKKVAKVNSEGHITSVALGTATISAKRNGYIAKCKVNVKAHYPENTNVLDFGKYNKKEPVNMTSEDGVVTYEYGKVKKTAADAYIKKLKAEGYTEVLESKVSAKKNFTREFVNGDTHVTLDWLNDTIAKQMTLKVIIK